MTIYIVENYNTDELKVFEELKQAAAYVREYYKNNLIDLLNGYHDDIERVLQVIKNDLENLESDYPFIEDAMYIRTATLYS